MSSLVNHQLDSLIVHINQDLNRITQHISYAKPLGRMSGIPANQETFRQGYEQKAPVPIEEQHTLESSTEGIFGGVLEKITAFRRLQQPLTIGQVQTGRQHPGYLVNFNAAPGVPLYGQGGLLSRNYLAGQLYRDCICCCRRFPVNFKLNNGIHCSRCSNKIRNNGGEDTLWWAARAAAENGRLSIEKMVHHELEKRTGRGLRVAIIIDDSPLQRTHPSGNVARSTRKVKFKLRTRVASVELAEEDILGASCKQERCLKKCEFDKNLAAGGNKGKSTSNPGFDAASEISFVGAERIEDAISFVLRNGGTITPDGELVSTEASRGVPAGFLPVIAFNPSAAMGVSG